MLDLQIIGTRLRAARKERRLTQSELGVIAGVSRAQIERLENGRAADMGLRATLRLIRAVGLDLTLQACNRGRPTLDELQSENQP